MVVRRRNRPQILRAAIGMGHRLERLEDRTLFSTITWSNKGDSGNDSDGFNRVFGGNAATARADVQQAVNDWQSIISDFHNPGNTLSLSISMSTSTGFGAGASYGGSWQSGGIPTQGSIGINTGSNANGAGWYLDPHPDDDSEFRGNIINAYSADATSGGPADGKADLYTVAALEIAHTLGLNDSTDDLFTSDPHGYLTNTGASDQAVVGTLWTYNGPDVNALFTSDNAGSQNRAHALHSAEPNAGNLISNGSGTYYGAQDSDNAIFEFSRRYVPSNLDALVLKDSYGYTINTPTRNMYATFDDTTGNLLLRGGQAGQAIYSSDRAQSSDTLTLDTSSITLPFIGTLHFVDSGVHIDKWVEGTGPDITLNNVWNLASVNSVTIDSGAGSDTININRVPAGVPVSVTSGGPATVNLGNSATGVQEILGPVSVENPNSRSTLNVNNTADAAAHNWSLSTFTPSGDSPWGRISALAPADITFENNDLTQLNINLGGGADVADIQQVGDASGSDQFITLVLAHGVGTTINVGDSSGVQNIFGTLLLSNPPHFSTINVDDNNDRTGRTVTLQQVNQPADPNNDPYDTLTGLAPGTIGYDVHDTTAAKITLGVGGNTVNVLNVSVATSLIGGAVLPIILGGATPDIIIPPILLGGPDTINIGNNGSVQTVIATLTMENPHGNNTINVDDGSDLTARTVTFDTSTSVAGDSAPYGTITGLALAPIQYEFDDTAALNVTFGVGGNTANVLNTGAPTNFFGGSVPLIILPPPGAASSDIILPPLRRGGPDTINIGNSGSVQSIAGPLTIENAWANNTINIDDGADSTARTLTLDTTTATPNDSAPYGTLAGLAPALISYEFDDTAAVNTTLGNGGDVVNVHATGVATNFFAAAGPDTFNITDAGSVQNIAGVLSLDNQTSFDTITIDDSADPTARTVTLSSFTPTADTPWQRISGLAPADITYEGDDVTPVTLDGGSGGNTFTISGVAPFHGNTGGITLNSGSGNDIVTISGTAPGMLLSVNGQGGDDALTVDFSSGNIAGGMTIAFDGGAGTDNLTVSGQSPGTPISVNAGHILDGTSSVNYTATVESLTLDPATFTVLDDLNGISLSTADAGTTLTINVTQHLSALNVGNFTSVKLAAGASPGGITVFTHALSVGSLAARLDLTNNALQVNYGGGTDPLAAVANQIATAYSGGSWSGAGITTSKGDATHALGYGDSVDGIVSGLPANSLLIKFTVAGDLNLDGHVNFADLLALAQHYNQTAARWDQGDLNYDGTVGFADLLKLAQNYNATLSAAPLAAAIAPAGLTSEPLKRRSH